MTRRKFPEILFLLSFFFFLAICRPDNLFAATKAADTGIRASDLKWLTATPSLSGFDADRLESAAENIGRMEGVYSVIVVRNNRLVLERYFREGTRTKPHNLKSVTKSVTAALVGIAIEKGYLRLDQPISDFLPQVKALSDPRKYDITVRHLLTMTSGLEQTSYQNYQSLAGNTDDWVSAILNRPLVAFPGTKHQYSTGDAHLLSAVLTRATGMSTRAFAEKYLFGPLDISVKGWDIDPMGINQGGNNLSLIPLDMARFGQLYLDGGVYGNQQIIPKWWIDSSTRPTYLGRHELYGYYGYLWYSRPRGYNAFVAVGYGGQYIYVSPGHNAVVVITSTLFSKGDAWETQLFDYIQKDLLGGPQPEGRPLQVKDDGNDSPASAQRKALTTTRLNLRRGPGVSNTVIRVLDADTTLEILGQQDLWLNVSAHGSNGWVAAEYVRFIDVKKPRFTSPLPERATPTEVPAGTVPGDAIARPDESLKALQNELAAAHRQISELEDARSRLMAQTTKAREQKEQDLAEERTLREALEKQLQAAADREKNTGMELAGLKKEIEKQRLEVAVQKTARLALETEVTGLQGRLKSQADALVTMQSDHDTLQNVLNVLIEESAGVEKATALAAADKMRLQDELQKANAEISELRASQDSVLARLGNTEKQLTTELDAERARRASVENRIKTIEQSRQAVSDALASMQSRLDSQAGILETVQAERDNLKAELTAMQGENAALKQAAGQAEAARSRLEAELATAREKMENFGENHRQSMAQATQTRNQLEQKLAEERVRREAVEKQTKEIEQSRQAVSEALASMQSRLNNQAGILETVQAERDNLKAELAAMQSTVFGPTAVKPMEPAAEKEPDLGKIISFVNAWADAWGRKNAGLYLARYSKQFKPPGDISLAEWKAQRHQRLGQPAFIKIDISDITYKAKGPGQAEVTFIQEYRSDTYSDRVKKTLDLQWENTGWTIIKETVIESL